jgi:hypothetical protein|tara:strand:- start:1083 stop:1607 length:525 start_codon:yes stop_codon:yes gene_type:complete
MGQYGNQPDFGTFAAVVTPTDTVSSATNLNASCLYVGTTGNVSCIITGVTGIQGVVNGASVLTSGAGYTTANGLATTSDSGQGTGLTVDIVAAGGLITAVALRVTGTGYRQGDVINVIQNNGSNGTLRISVTDSLPGAANVQLFKNIASGTFLPMIVDYVFATGTTATDIIAVK